MSTVSLSESPTSQSAGTPEHPRENQAVRLPYTLQELKALIPADCFRPTLWLSLAYVALDFAVVGALVWIAAQINAWWFWPIYWVLQGTMMWALFVLGHDCGHGSFSRKRWINHLFGHICHSPLLVPYHGWRISHRTHHTLHGDADREETWYPMTATEYREMPGYVRLLRFTPMLLWLFPFYLARRSPRHDGSHFHPGSDLFKPQEKWQVITSTAWWLAMFAGLVAAGVVYGPLAAALYYVGPYLVFIAWLDLVTYLHHTDPDVPWYRGKEWSFAKGALSAVDRNYGMVNEIHHNIGTHVLHHLFINIPHYKLRRATEALAPHLGEHYFQTDEPFWRSFERSRKQCHFINDEGHTTYFKSASDP